jgi:hypothetical protein
MAKTFVILFENDEVNEEELMEKLADFKPEYAIEVKSGPQGCEHDISFVYA